MILLVFHFHFYYGRELLGFRDDGINRHGTERTNQIMRFKSLTQTLILCRLFPGACCVRWSPLNVSLFRTYKRNKPIFLKHSCYCVIWDYKDIFFLFLFILGVIHLGIKYLYYHWRSLKTPSKLNHVLFLTKLRHVLHSQLSRWIHWVQPNPILASIGTLNGFFGWWIQFSFLFQYKVNIIYQKIHIFYICWNILN